MQNVRVIYPPDRTGETTRQYDFEAPDGPAEDVCEVVYAEFNRGSRGGNEYISRQSLQERSLSVGDMVEIGTQTYVIDRFGTRTISPEGKAALLATTFSDRQLMENMPA